MAAPLPPNSSFSQIPPLFEDTFIKKQDEIRHFLEKTRFIVSRGFQNCFKLFKIAGLIPADVSDNIIKRLTAHPEPALVDKLLFPHRQIQNGKPIHS